MVPVISSLISPGPPGPPGPQGTSGIVAPHYVNVRVANDAINNAIANGAPLQFDTIDFDLDGFAPKTTPFDTITVPEGLDGIYLIASESSTSGNQGITVGMGVAVNGTTLVQTTNQYVKGPSSVTYSFTSNPTRVTQLVAGDQIQLVNNSVSGGNNAFTSVFLALIRLA